MTKINERRCRRIRAGFTVVDLVIVLVTLMLATVFAGAYFLRPSRTRSSRINCVAHLKQVGLAFLMWANDNEEKFPMAVSTKQGGTMEYNYTGQVFRHYEAMKNALNSPKVLRCPDDTNRLPATAWGSALKNQNLSYFVGLNADQTNPQIILSGDRHIKGGVITNGNVRVLDANSTAGWRQMIHYGAGNIGLADGSAQQVTDQMLRAQLARISNGPTHAAIP